MGGGAGLAIAAGALALLAGATVAELNKDTPYAQFARFCYWGKGHNPDDLRDARKEEEIRKWLDGSLVDFRTDEDLERGLRKQAAGLMSMIPGLLDMRPLPPSHDGHPHFEQV